MKTVLRLQTPAALLVLASAAAVAAPKGEGRVLPEVTRIRLMIDGRAIDVAAHIYKPPGKGPFPLVIYSHGRAVSRDDRARLQYPVAIGHGNYWLRKGVALVAPVRPGYGDTGGADVEDSGSNWRGSECRGQPDFTRTATNARRVVAGTHDWAMHQPWVRKDRILLEGQSVGGMTTIAAAALNLRGVVGVVNFAGGAGGSPDTSPGRSCHPENLTRTYRQFGQQAKVPSLWLYASNDLFWGREAPRTWHQAYRAGGSDAAFVMTGPLPEHDGHQLLLHGGRMWSVPLDAFIRKVGLTAP